MGNKFTPCGCDEPNVRSLVGNRPVYCKLPFITPQGLETAAAFRTHTQDVIIVTYPKTGTTWLQQLCHQLRMIKRFPSGHMDFDEISEEGVVPWIEVGPSIGIDINAVQLGIPRFFKTHQSLSQLSLLDARFVCTLREPEAVLLSYFKFMVAKGLAGKKPDVNVFARCAQWATPDFVTEKLKPFDGHLFGTDLWTFFREIWICRDLPNVHVLVYDEMKKDLDAMLPDLAGFLGLEASIANKDARSIILKMSSFQFMKDNEERFDDHHMGPRIATIMKKKGGPASVPPSRTSSKVGLQVGKDINTTINEETRALIQSMWEKNVTPFTGHKSYNDLVADVLSKN